MRVTRRAERPRSSSGDAAKATSGASSKKSDPFRPCASVGPKSAPLAGTSKSTNAPDRVRKILDTVKWRLSRETAVWSEAMPGRDGRPRGRASTPGAEGQNPGCPNPTRAHRTTQVHLVAAADLRRAMRAVLNLADDRLQTDDGVVRLADESPQLFASVAGRRDPGAWSCSISPRSRHGRQRKGLVRRDRSDGAHGKRRKRQWRKHGRPDWQRRRSGHADGRRNTWGLWPTWRDRRDGARAGLRRRRQRLSRRRPRGAR